MLHTCVRIFDVMGTVENYFELNGAQLSESGTLQLAEAVLRSAQSL